MHELHLAEDLLAKVKAAAEAEAKEKVYYVKAAIGATRVTDAEELKSLFASISKGTIADAAILDVEIVPVKAACADCNKDVVGGKFSMVCAQCGSPNIQMVSGSELKIIELK